MREPRAARPLFQALKDCILVGKEEMDVPTVSSQARCLLGPGNYIGELHGGSKTEHREGEAPQEMTRS